MDATGDPLRKRAQPGGGGAEQPYAPPPVPGGWQDDSGYAPPQGYASALSPEPPYGYAPPPSYGPPGRAPETSSRAVVALVLAVVAWTFPFVPAVGALVLAPGARAEIARSGGRLGGEGLVRAAVVLAWLNIALCLLAVLVVGLLVVAALR